VNLPPLVPGFKASCLDAGKFRLLAYTSSGAKAQPVAAGSGPSFPLGIRPPVATGPGPPSS
jgi:hypothetical protein